MSERTIDIPYALNDLGVRRFDSMRDFAYLNSERIGIPLPTTRELIIEAANEPRSKLAHFFDAVVLLTGDYGALEKVVQTRGSEIMANHDFELLIYSGTVLAAIDTAQAVRYYKTAEKCAPNMISRVTALHRAAVTQLKRAKDYGAARAQMQEMLDIPLESLNDKLIAVALIDNLYCLLLTLEDFDKELFASELLIQNAHLMTKCIISNEKVSSKKKSQAARYRSQIAINHAQLLVHRKDFSGAVKILLNNLDATAQDASEYICEAQGCLAYAYYLADEWENSIHTAKEAIRAYSAIGDLKGLRTTREILVGAYEKAGRHSDALAEIERIEKDPLGEGER